MWRDNKEVVLHREVSFVLNHGAMGDVIASLPALVYARQMHSRAMKMNVWAPSYQNDVLRELLDPYGPFNVRPFEKLMENGIDRKTQKSRCGPLAMNSIHGNTFTRNRADMVDFAFATLLDMLPENDMQRSYPTAAPLGPMPKISIPDRYVVVPTGSTSPNKDFVPAVLGPVLRGLLDMGFAPVITGSSKSHTVIDGPDNMLQPIPITNHYDALPNELRQRCIDTRDKISLVELRSLVGHAEAIIGMDGGTLHLAGTTNTRIAYICTHIRPVHRTIRRHGVAGWRQLHVTPRDLECAGCQSNWNLVFNHDFRGCMYNDFNCVSAIDPRAVLESLTLLMGEDNEIPTAK